MVNEVCTEPSQFPEPQYTVEMRLDWVTQHINEILIPFSLFKHFTTCLWFNLHSSYCGTSMVSCIWKQHIILTTHQPSEVSLVGCQWQPMCHQEWQWSSGSDHSKIKFIYLQIVQYQAYRTLQQTDDNELPQTDHKVNDLADSPGAWHAYITKSRFTI